MVADLGLDLDAIEKASGGHSIFAPSGSSIWLNSPGCLIPNVLAPDSAGEDAAYGTVGHEIGEQWLKAIPRDVWGMGSLADAEVDAAEPRHRLGEIVEVAERDTVFRIEVDQEMLDYVRKYVEWCMELPGEHYIEQRVDFSDLTPIPNQGGTADHTACRPAVLVETDLKMGKGVRVFAKGNTQLMLYAYGFFKRWDWVYNFERIIIRIAQPRLDHFDVWECSREELLAFAEHVREQARKAWALNGERKPGWWCKKGFCNVQGDCAAWANWIEDMADEVFRPTEDRDECPVCDGLGCDACRRQITVDEDGVIEGVAYTVAEMASVDQSLAAGKADLTPRREPGKMTTAALAALLPYRSNVERFFEMVERELESRAIDGEEVPGYKLTAGRVGRRYWVEEKDALEDLLFMGLNRSEVISKMITPAGATDLVRKKLGCTKKSAEAMLDSLVRRTPSRQTLVPVNDERPALTAPADDVFEDASGL